MIIRLVLINWIKRRKRKTISVRSKVFRELWR
jgi:hypothetical protein